MVVLAPAAVVVVVVVVATVSNNGLPVLVNDSSYRGHDPPTVLSVAKSNNIGKHRRKPWKTNCTAPFAVCNKPCGSA